MPNPDDSPRRGYVHFHFAGEAEAQSWDSFQVSQLLASDSQDPNPHSFGTMTAPVQVLVSHKSHSPHVTSVGSKNVRFRGEMDLRRL